MRLCNDLRTLSMYVSAITDYDVKSEKFARKHTRIVSLQFAYARMIKVVALKRSEFLIQGTSSCCLRKKRWNNRSLMLKTDARRSLLFSPFSSISQFNRTVLGKLEIIGDEIASLLPRTESTFQFLSSSFVFFFSIFSSPSSIFFFRKLTSDAHFRRGRF